MWTPTGARQSQRCIHDRHALPRACGRSVRRRCQVFGSGAETRHPAVESRRRLTRAFVPSSALAATSRRLVNQQDREGNRQARQSRKVPVMPSSRAAEQRQAQFKSCGARYRETRLTCGQVRPQAGASSRGRTSRDPGLHQHKKA